MSLKAKLVAFLALFLWSSAFVAIRAGLHEFSPEGLALFRYLVASITISIACLFLKDSEEYLAGDRLKMMALGAIGVGVYNLFLNYGELTVTSATACFIVGQSPVIIALFASLVLGERMPLSGLWGFAISFVGIALIAIAEQGGFKMNQGLIYTLLATVAGSIFTVMQKPYIQKYNAMRATAYAIWGGTLFLMIFSPHLRQDMSVVSSEGIIAAIYLGVFPAVIGYVAWGYVLKITPVSRAASLLYITPFMTMVLGWLYLKEEPLMLTMLGGILAMLGVFFVNQAYKRRAKAELKMAGQVAN